MISPQSQNPYVYCMNNPLRYIDPSGMTLADDPGYVPGCLETYYGGEYHYFPAMDGYCNVSDPSMDYQTASDFYAVLEGIKAALYGSTNANSNFTDRQNGLYLDAIGDARNKIENYDPSRFSNKDVLFYVLFSYTPSANPTMSAYLQYIYETKTGKTKLFTGASVGLAVPGGMIIIGILDFSTIDEYKNTPTIDIYGGYAGPNTDLTFGYRNGNWEWVGMGVGVAAGKNLGATASSIDYITFLLELSERMGSPFNHFLPRAA